MTFSAYSATLQTVQGLRGLRRSLTPIVPDPKQELKEDTLAHKEYYKIA